MNTVIPFRAQPPLDAYTLALQFLKRVLPPEGVYFAGVKTKRGAWKDTHHSTIEDLCTHLIEADRNGGDAMPRQELPLHGRGTPDNPPNRFTVSCISRSSSVSSLAR